MDRAVLLGICQGEGGTGGGNSIAPSVTLPETCVSVDASDVAVGAELAQRARDGVWQPVNFFSKTLSPAERKYSAFDKELLAIYTTIKHFRHFLEGRHFTVYSDHKPLSFALDSAADRLPRQTRHLSFIAQFTTDIRHVKGTANVVADALSCPDLPLISVNDLSLIHI